MRVQEDGDSRYRSDDVARSDAAPSSASRGDRARACCAGAAPRDAAAGRLRGRELAAPGELASRGRSAPRAGRRERWPRRAGPRQPRCATATASSSKCASTTAPSPALDELRAAGRRGPRRQPPLPDGHRRGRPGQPAGARPRSPGSRRQPGRSTPVTPRRPASGSVDLRGRRPARRRRSPRRLRRRRQRRHRRHPLRLLRHRRRRPPTDAADDVASGDLPGRRQPLRLHRPGQRPRRLRRRRSRPTRARAMAQIVHDLAPGAPISPSPPPSPAKSPSPKTSSGAGRPAGADGDRRRRRLLRRAVLPGRPGRGRDRRSRRAEASPTSPPPATTTCSTANGNEIASWEAPAFRDSGGCPPAARSAAPASRPTTASTSTPSRRRTTATFGITVEPKKTLNVDLQWAEPWNGVEADLDAYLLDEAGEPLLEGPNLVGSTDNNVASGLESTAAAGRVLRLGKRRPPETEVQLVDQPLLQQAAATRAPTPR